VPSIKHCSGSRYKKSHTSIDTTGSLEANSLCISELNDIIHGLIGFVELVDLAVGFHLIGEDTKVLLVVVGFFDVLVLEGVGLLVIGHKATVHLCVLDDFDPVLAEEVHVAEVHENGLLEHAIVFVDFPMLN
jgi:hypothetical protein